MTAANRRPGEGDVIDLAQKAEAFCEASIRDWTGRAARMLADTPQIAGYNFATAVVFGDATRVRREIEHDPAAATRPDPRTGWTPLHAVCGSRWHRLDPARADGLAAVARLLLDAGADPGARIAGSQGRPGRSPLSCAIATASTSASNQPVIRLLLERGAVPDDHDLYLAAFAEDARQCLPLLLEHVASMTGSTALAAPVSTGNIEVVRLLLQAGAEEGNTEAVRLMLDLGIPADARRDDDGATALHAAAFSGSAGTVRLLLDRGAGIEAHDAAFSSSPLGWAIVGSGYQPARSPAPDWIATVQALIEGGASTQDVTLSPDDPKPPSQDVAELLRGYGIADGHHGTRE